MDHQRRLLVHTLTADQAEARERRSGRCCASSRRRRPSGDGDDHVRCRGCSHDRRARRTGRTRGGGGCCRGGRAEGPQPVADAAGVASECLEEVLLEGLDGGLLAR